MFISFFFFQQKSETTEEEKLFSFSIVPSISCCSPIFPHATNYMCLYNCHPLLFFPLTHPENYFIIICSVGWQWLAFILLLQLNLPSQCTPFQHHTAPHYPPHSSFIFHSLPTTPFFIFYKHT